MIGVVGIRGVMIPTPESESESDFPHFSESVDSVFNSNSGKNRFLYCTGIDSGYWNRLKNRKCTIPILIPAKNGIITPLVCMQFAQLESVLLIRVIENITLTRIVWVRSHYYWLIYFYPSQEKWLKSLNWLISLELLNSYCKIVVMSRYTGWSNWTQLWKLKYFICCLIDLFLFLVWHLSNSIPSLGVIEGLAWLGC